MYIFLYILLVTHFSGEPWLVQKASPERPHRGQLSSAHWMVHGWRTVVPKRSCNQGLRRMKLVMTFHIFVFLALLFSFLELFIWPLGWSPIQAPLPRPPYAGRRKKFWRYFSSFDLLPSTFPLPVLSTDTPPPMAPPAMVFCSRLP